MKGGLRRHDLFWPCVALLAIATYLLPAIELWTDTGLLFLVIPRVVVGSMVLLLVLAIWARAGWARKLARELRADGSRSVHVVWVNDLGKPAFKTMVMVIEPAGLTFRYRHRRVDLAREHIEQVSHNEGGVLKSETVLVNASTFGAIEITRLGRSAVFPRDDGDAIELMKQIAEVKST